MTVICLHLVERRHPNIAECLGILWNAFPWNAWGRDCTSFFDFLINRIWHDEVAKTGAQKCGWKRKCTPFGELWSLHKIQHWCATLGCVQKKGVKKSQLDSIYQRFTISKPDYCIWHECRWIAQQFHTDAVRFVFPVPHLLWTRNLRFYFLTWYHNWTLACRDCGFPGLRDKMHTFAGWMQIRNILQQNSHFKLKRKKVTFLPKPNSLGGVDRLQSVFPLLTTKRDDMNALSEGDRKSSNRWLVLVKAI